jgi:hypothetical protein
MGRSVNSPSPLTAQPTCSGAPAGPNGGRRDQVIYYQYRHDRARRALRGIDAQARWSELRLRFSPVMVNRGHLQVIPDVRVWPVSVAALTTRVNCAIVGALAVLLPNTPRTYDLYGR